MKSSFISDVVVAGATFLFFRFFVDVASLTATPLIIMLILIGLNFPIIIAIVYITHRTLGKDFAIWRTISSATSTFFGQLLGGAVVVYFMLSNDTFEKTIYGNMYIGTAIFVLSFLIAGTAIAYVTSKILLILVKLKKET